MPLLARMLAAPLVVDVRPGAVGTLGGLLSDRRIATSGRVAVAVGPNQGDSVAAELQIESAEIFRVCDGSHDTAVSLGKQLRADSYEAVAGIGGGKTIDVTKFAAHMAGIPMVAVATNLSHDGIASRVSSLEHESGKSSYGVVPPVAVLVDLDRVRNGPPRLVRSGDRKSTRLNSSHGYISYAVFCLKKNKDTVHTTTMCSGTRPRSHAALAT